MAVKDLIYDPAQLDFEHIVADLEEIRSYNPQRYEMEQITAIVVDDFEAGICIGYKDITDQEFWVRGHMPGMPLMPGKWVIAIADRPSPMARHVDSKSPNARWEPAPVITTCTPLIRRNACCG